MSAALAFALQCPDLDTKYAALTALSSLLSASETDWNKFETDFYNPLQKRVRYSVDFDEQFRNCFWVLCVCLLVFFFHSQARLTLSTQIAIESTPDLLWFLTSEFEELWLPVSRLIGELAYRNSAVRCVVCAPTSHFLCLVAL